MTSDHKTVVIVGACGGIGSYLAKSFGQSKLILVDRDGKGLRNNFGEENEKLQFYSLDLTNISEVEKTAKDIVSKNSQIDVLINAAGIGIYKPIEEVTVKDWQFSIDINVTGVFLMTKYLLPSLKNSEKSYVVSLGSGMGMIPVAGRSVYCMTKFALRGMMLSLAKEFENTNVHFLHMVLGSVLTEFGPMSLDEKKEKSLSGKSYLTAKSVSEKVYNLIDEATEESEIEMMPSGYEKPENR